MIAEALHDVEKLFPAQKTLFAPTVGAGGELVCCGEAMEPEMRRVGYRTVYAMRCYGCGFELFTLPTAGELVAAQPAVELRGVSQVMETVDRVMGRTNQG